MDLSNTSSQPPFHDPALLGRKVRVVLNEHDADAIAIGKLLSFSAMGEVVLLGEDGDVHWCWPGLQITPVRD